MTSSDGVEVFDLVLIWLKNFRSSKLTGQVTMHFRGGQMMSADVRHELPLVPSESQKTPPPYRKNTQAPSKNPLTK